MNDNIYINAKKLPNMPATDEINNYIEFYNIWKASNNTYIQTKSIDKSEKISAKLSLALAAALDKYRQIKINMAETIEKNFVIKLIYWFDFIMKNHLTKWDRNSNINLIAYNVTKEQEHLFFDILKSIGINVEISDKAEEKIMSAPVRVTIPQRLDRNPVVNIPERPNRNPIVNIPEITSRNPVVNISERPNRNPVVNIPKRPEREQSAITEKSFEELALLASSVVMITIHDNTGKIIGSGSGIMIGKAGYILTNHHVACGGSFYTVKIEDDENSYETDQIIKYNQLLDLAIIKIDRPLKPLPIYKGEKSLVRGQKVVAIGSPLGLFNSVSDGIIAGFRNINEVEMIQFTAPISHGSSGGALLNMYGQVIGISTAGFDDGQNINLAVGYEFINTFVRGFE